jgi:ubiquitin-conjugating enzyme E2 variant
MTAVSSPHRRPWHALRRTVLAGSVVATICLIFWVGRDVVRFVSQGSWIAVGLSIVLGALAIDFVTGLVHFACDRFGGPTTPVFGPLLIRAFREHHEDPGAIEGHDWIETNGEPCVVTTVALIALAFLAPSAQSSVEIAAVAAVWTMAFFGAYANQAHKWAHMQDPPRVVRFAQRAGLTLSPERHARHHDGPHDTAYCITTGWMNPILDRLGLWTRLERSLKGTT